MSGKIKFHKLRLPSSRSSQNSQISNFFKPPSVEEQSNSCPLPSRIETETLESCCNSPQTKKPRSCSPFKMDEISLSPNMEADDKSFSSKDSPEKMHFFDKTTSEFDFLPSTKERKTKKTVHNKPKTSGRKTERKQPKIKNIFSKDNRKLSKLLTAQSIAEGVNPDELQLALALSISEATQNAEEDYDTQMNEEVPVGIQLQKFEYNPNCNRNAGEIEFFPLYYKRKGKTVNRFTALTMRNPKRQNQKVEKYVSQFLIDSCDKKNLTEKEKEIDQIEISSDVLECMKAEASIIQLHAFALKEIENYFVKGVFQPSIKKAGCLLRDYRKIPGRSLSPEPIKKHVEMISNNSNDIMNESVEKNKKPTILLNDQSIASQSDPKEELQNTPASDHDSPKTHDLSVNRLSVNSFITSILTRETSPDLFSEFETELDKTESLTEANCNITSENRSSLQTIQEESKISEMVIETKHTQENFDNEDCGISTYEKYSSDEVEKILKTTSQEPSSKSLDCVIDLTEGDECEVNSSIHSSLRNHLCSPEKFMSQDSFKSPEKFLSQDSLKSPAKFLSQDSLNSPAKFLSQDSLKSSSSSCIVLSDDEVNYSIRKADETLKKLKKIVTDANEEPGDTSELNITRKSFEYSRLDCEFQRKLEAFDASSFLKTPVDYLKKYQKEDKAISFMEFNEKNEKSCAKNDNSPHEEKKIYDDISMDDCKTNFSHKSEEGLESNRSPICSPLSEFDKILHHQLRFDSSVTGPTAENSLLMHSSYTNICKIVNDDINTFVGSECNKISSDQYIYNISNPSSPISSNKIEMHKTPSPISGIGNVADIKRSYNFESDSDENHDNYQKNLDLKRKLVDANSDSDGKFNKYEFAESRTSGDDRFNANYDGSATIMSPQKNSSPIVYEITDSDSEEWKDPVIQAVDVLKYSPLKNKKKILVEDLNFDANTSRVSKCLEERFLGESLQNSTPKLSSMKFRRNNSDSTLMDTTIMHKSSFRRYSSTKKFSDLIDDDINYSDLDEIDKLVHGSAAMQYGNFKKPVDIERLLSATIEGEMQSSFSMDMDNFKKPKISENLGASCIEKNIDTSMEEFVQDGVKYKVRYKNISLKPDYSDMDNESLTQELNKYGLKPLKKKQAVIMLEYIYNQMHPVILDSEIRIPASEASPEKNFNGFSLDKTSECTEETGSQQKTSKYKNFNFEDCTGERLLYNDALSSEVEDEYYILPTNTRKKVSSCLLPFHVAWFNLVKSNRKLRQAILCYEPVDLQEIFLFFKSIGYRYDPKDIKSFFDKRCIIFRYDLSDGTSNRHTRKKGKRLKNIRASQR